MLKPLVLLTISTIAGLLLGGASALYMSGLIGPKSIDAFSDIDVEGWRSDRSIGSASADPYTRARVSRHGLLALAKEEAIYFTRATDDADAPLDDACIYELSGGQQDAFWWSITLYDADSRLPMNDDDALSIDATTIGEDAKWTATISPTQPETGHWLSSRNADLFDLTLRLYRPADEVILRPEETLIAPSIRKLSCGETS